ncbi:MAG: tetratricopeptide repeat protein [Candidatus Melainabacteria bacterium]|nr:tetratricopeptide repeat protein [Candidatus Melainabacteria bacterium]
MKKVVLSTILGASCVLGLSGTQNAGAAQDASSHASHAKLFKGRISYQVAKAEELWLQRKYDDAAVAFRKEMKRHPRNLDATAGLGMSLVMQFKLDGAEEQFDRVLTKQPDNAIAHTGKAFVAMNRLQSSSKTYIDKRSELLSSAENEAQAALQADSTLPQAHYALGSIYKEQNKLEEAYAKFKQATDLDPTYSDAYSQMAMLDLQQNRNSEAAANAREAITCNTANSTAHYALGESLLRQGSTDAAIKELNTALYLHRNSAPIHIALGKAYESQGNADAALKQYERASLIKPEAKEPNERMVGLHIALGKQYETQNNTVGALKEYRQASLIDPHHPEPYLHMAQLRENRGDLELAIAELRSGAEINRESPVLYQRIGEASLKLDKTDDAIKAFERALTLSPQNPALVDGLSRSFYVKAQKESAGSFLMSNEFENAKVSLEKAIKLNPSNLRLRLAMAKLRALAGETVDLKSIGAPTNDAERVAYAEALLAQNKFPEAQQQMLQVINGATDPHEIAAVGDLALMIKDLDSASLAYKKTSELGQHERAKRGMTGVVRAREESRRHVTLGQDLAKRKQLGSAVDTFRAATAANPRLADARLGLAQSEERYASKSPAQLRDAAEQYRAYLSLSPDLDVKVQKRISKKIERIESRATKLDKKVNIVSADTGL